MQRVSLPVLNKSGVETPPHSSEPEDMQREDFEGALSNAGLVSLRRQTISTVQINLGKLCNQACLHCHVEAGPTRTEIMERETLDHILSLLKSDSAIDLVDLTGGAPEMNPHFRDFVRQVRALGIRVIDRCNLTILSEPGHEDLAEFLAGQGVEISASLPCYSEENVNKQRGKGVFERSIDALKSLNDLGYAKPGSGLILNLVYNPGGAFLPPSQDVLQQQYREELGRDHGIVFNNLFTITNMPIKRFAHTLHRDGKHDEYMALLATNFNPEAAQSVMCKTLISVGWDGKLYDCDFNQMLEMQSADVDTIGELAAFAQLNEGPIIAANHCFGCTAGSGSSCGGALD